MKRKNLLEQAIDKVFPQKPRRIVCKGELSNVDVEFISLLVDDMQPANAKGFVIKSESGTHHKHIVNSKKFTKGDGKSKGLIYATVMEPGVVDSHGDSYKPEEVKKAAHNFAAKGSLLRKNDVNHSNQPIDDMIIVESSILKAADAEHYPNTALGSWVMTLKCSNLAGDFWQKVEKGNFNGVSIYATAVDTGDNLAKAQIDAMKDLVTELRKAGGSDTDSNQAIEHIESKIKALEKQEQSSDMNAALAEISKSLKELNGTMKKSISKALQGEPDDSAGDSETVVNGQTIIMKAAKSEVYKAFGDVESGNKMNILTPNTASQFVDEVLASGAKDTFSDITVVELGQDNKVDLGFVNDLVFAVDTMPTAAAVAALSKTITPSVLVTAASLNATTVEHYNEKLGKEGFGAYVESKLVDKVNKAIRKLLFKGNTTTGILAALIKPSAEASAKAKELGLDFNVAALASKGLAGFLTDLRDKTGGSTEALAALVPSVEALPAVLALTGSQLETFNSKLGEIEKSAGAMESAFAKNAATTEMEIKKLSTAFQIFSARLAGEFAPAVNETARTLTEFLEKLYLYRDELKKAGKAVVTFTAVLASAKVGALAYNAVFVSSTATVVALSNAWKTLTVSMLANPYVLAASAIAAGIYYISEAVKKFQADHEQAVYASTHKTSELVEAGTDKLKEYGDAFQNAIKHKSASMALEAFNKLYQTQYTSLDELIAKQKELSKTKIYIDEDEANEAAARLTRLNQLIQLKMPEHHANLLAYKKVYLDAKNQMELTASSSTLENLKKELSTAEKLHASITITDKASANAKLAALQSVLDIKAKINVKELSAETAKNSEIERLANDFKAVQLASMDTEKAELTALENQYQAKRKKLIELGFTEVEGIFTKSGADDINFQAALNAEKLAIEARYADDRAKQETENERVRAEFARRNINTARLSLETRLSGVDEYYKKNMDALKKAGFDEVTITKATEAEKARVRDEYNTSQLRTASKIFGNIAKTAKAFGKKGFKTWKAFAIAQATVDTFMAANRALASAPPPLNFILAATTVAAGLANVATIAKTKPPKAATGGFLKGNSHAAGGVIIEAEGGEYIMQKSRVAALGTGFMNFINSAPLDYVRTALSNMPRLNMPVPSVPQVAYASGGQVSGGLDFQSLLEEMRALRADLRDKQFTAYISANEVVQTADSAIVSEQAEHGTIKRSNI